ncbi:hypothetical protein [Paractinoplanes rishiriensis]|nr:hypothetical protein [Actinoplanes rishiriensis]
MTRTTKAGGLVLAAGAVTWATTLLVARPEIGQTETLEILGGFAYQAGLAGFLSAAWSTGALGAGRTAKAFCGLRPLSWILRARVWPAPLRYLPLIGSLTLPVAAVVVLTAGNLAGQIVQAAGLALVWGGTGIHLQRRELCEVSVRSA